MRDEWRRNDHAGGFSSTSFSTLMTLFCLSACYFSLKLQVENVFCVASTALGASITMLENFKLKVPFSYALN